MFYKLFKDEYDTQAEMKVNYREAVRAVILSQDKILLVQNNKGDYKFPGGGVEKNESHVDALIREIAEETGYVDCEVGQQIGVVVESHIDEFDSNAIFQMKSYYYECTIRTPKKADQLLDGYELDLGFTPVWVTIGEAIEENDKLCAELEHNGWIRRENYVLELLKKSALR
ncbi:NUDIX hydrolase [Bacillus sp. FJAT-27225]|uniref:NUDIX hydrolase n=1 Tax=Bacillus sp. FJAT-27225 TaxID=1743144 RepID=UPI00080C21D4|nr:NUDIX domain-containing protein [Bacillus sp. FJAT-27225]OCA84078.1 NUDIX hydrolase [Bacillus sp. FJAT-27225]